MDLIKKFLQLFFLNCLWLICCLPVITAGGATCAAYAVALRLADDDEEVQSVRGIVRRFFKAFKQDFLQGLLLFLFTGACGGIGYFIFTRLREDAFNLILTAVFVIYILAALILNLYAYPLVARYSNTFLNTLRNSVALYIMNIKTSFKTMVIVLVEIVALYFTRYIFYVGILIIPALIFYTVSRTAKDIFVRMENPAPVEEENTESENEAEKEEVTENELDAADENEGDEPTE